MYIKSIHIISFGRLRNFDCELSQGLNVIEGSNESGKSTLLSFIKFMLYGAGTRPREDMTLPERRLVLPWDGTPASGTMTVVCEDGEYRIERELTLIARPESATARREEYRERLAVVDTATGAPVLQNRCPGEALLGIPEEVFCGTAMVGQLSGAYVNGESISGAIENLLFSADESVNAQKALDKLGEARRKLLYKSRKGGDIYELECERAELRARVSDAQRSSTEVLALENTVADCREKLRKNAARTSEVVRLTEASEAMAASNRFDILHAHEKKIAELDEQLAVLGDGQSENDAATLATLRARIADCASAENGVTLAEARLEGCLRGSITTDSDEYVNEIYRMGGRDEAERQFDRHRRAARSTLAAAVIFLVLGVLAIGFGVAAYFVNNTVGYASALVGLLLAAVSVTCFVLRRRHGDSLRRSLTAVGAMHPRDFLLGLDNLFEIEHIREQARSEIAEAQFAADQAHARLNDASTALASALGETNTDAAVLAGLANSCVDELESRLAKRTALVAERDRQLSALRFTQEQIGQTDEAAARQALGGADLSALASVNPTALRREREFLLSSSAALTEKLGEAERRLAALGAVSYDPRELSERIDTLDRRIEELTLRHDAYALAQDTLAAAGESLRRSLSPRVSASACTLLDAMTDGKYRQLGVGNGFTLSCEADGMTREVDYLSSGTRDLTYVALRLALVDLLCHGELPPVFFDETFARLDDGRLQNVLRTAATLARDGKQLLLFTCQRREAAALSGLEFKRIMLG